MTDKRIYRAALIAALAALALPVSAAVAGFQILFGRPADPAKYPYVAALSRSDGMSGPRRYFCGGTLVNERWIVTAAHCFHDSNGERLPDNHVWAIAGTGELTEVPPDGHVAVESITVHPDYDPATQQNDIALVRLARPQPAKAYPDLADAPPEEDRSLQILGFGAVKEGQSSRLVRTRSGEEVRLTSSRLMIADVPFVPMAKCRELLGAAMSSGEQSYSLTGSMMCAGGRKQDSCQGDSGGPLLTKDIKPKLIGVVSYGYGCGRNGVPAVYTRIQDYRAWIGELTSAS